MSLYEGSKTKVKVGSEFSEEFYVAIGAHQESCFVTFIFCNCDGCCDRECQRRLHERGDLALMSEMMEGLKKRIEGLK